MIDQLETDLRRLAEQFDAAAPPLTGTEARSRHASIAATDDAPVELATPPRRRAGVGRLLIAGSLVIASVVAVLVVLANRPTNSVQPVATPETQPVPQTTTSISPTSTTTSPPTTTLPLSEQLDQIAATVVDRLSTLQSIGFTVTIRQTGQPDVSNNVVLRSDGAFWAEREGFWGSYDPATGLLRGAYTNPDGSPGYDEIAGQTDTNPGVGILMGHQAAPATSQILTAQSVVESTHDGRPAWRLDFSSTAFNGLELSQTLLIDQATGILVSEIDRTTDKGVETTQQSDFTDLVVNAQLPAEFPGSFPPDANINRSGDPSQAPMSSVDEATQRYGPGFVAPADLPPGTWIQVVDGPRATIVAHRGFVTSQINLAAGLGRPPDATVPVGLPTLTAGDLAGVGYEVAGEGNIIVLVEGGSMYITAPTTEEALRIANSLKRYS